MKLKKSQLKELIRQAIVEDIMDKEIKNPKTGNMVKVRTALQLPDEHPANKKAKDMVAKAGIDKDDVGGPSYPNVKKGVKTSKQAKGKDKPAFVKPSTTGQGYSYDEPSHADDVEDNWDKASKGFDSMADKYGVRIDDQSDWSGYENNPQGEYSVSGKNSEDPGDGFSVYSTVETGEDGESYDGNKNIIAFPQDDDPFGGQVEVEFDSIGDAQKALDDILSDKRIKKVLDGGRGSMAKAKDYIKKELESWEANPKISGDDAADKANAKMDAAEKAAKKKKKGKVKSNPFSKKEVKESKGRRFTVKEVRMWMKKLEENRYKKVYNSDARRVAWMVNNEGVELSEMPKSMSKKWTKAQYGRERYLATEFIKAKSEQMTESKLRGMIRGIIKEQLNEDYKNSEWEVYVKDEKGKEKIVKKAKSKRAATILYNKIIKSDDYYEVGMKVVKEGNLKEAYRSQSIFFDKKDKSKLEKLLKKNKGKFPFNPSGEPVVNWSLNDKGSKGLEWSGIPKAKYNKAVEFFMKNKLNPRG